MRVLLLMLVACGHDESRPDAAARALDLDVTVGHDGVMVFANGTDDGNVFLFPQVGETTTWGDADTPDTCFVDISVEAAGETTRGSRFYFDSFMVPVDVTSAPDAILHLTGCGGSAHVPIGGLHTPAPTSVTAVKSDSTAIAVSWSADSHARTALLRFDGFWIVLSHVADSSYMFTPTFGNADDYRSVIIQTFGTMSVVGTAFGIVKVWPGDVSGAEITALSSPN